MELFFDEAGLFGRRISSAAYEFTSFEGLPGRKEDGGNFRPEQMGSDPDVKVWLSDNAESPQ